MKKPKAGEIYTFKNGKRRYVVLGLAHYDRGYNRQFVIFKHIHGLRWYMEPLEDFRTDYVKV